MQFIGPSVRSRRRNAASAAQAASTRCEPAQASAAAGRPCSRRAGRAGERAPSARRAQRELQEARVEGHGAQVGGRGQALVHAVHAAQVAGGAVERGGQEAQRAAPARQARVVPAVGAGHQQERRDQQLLRPGPGAWARRV